MKIKKTLVFITSLVLLFVLSTTAVLAQPPAGGGNPPAGGGNPSTGGGNNPGEDGGQNQNLDFKIENPFKFGDTIPDLLKAIVNEILLPIGGMLAVLMFIYAGFMYVTAQGDESKVKKAHQALLYTAIGTAILLGAWAITEVLENTINQLTR